MLDEETKRFCVVRVVLVGCVVCASIQLEKMRSQRKTMHSERFNTVGSSERKTVMADSKMTLFEARYFRFAGSKLYFRDINRYSQVG